MKILVVEDDAAITQVLEQLFADYNYAVDVAGDGEVGLQLAQAYDYDLILLDVMLPKLDGLSLCQQLRAQGNESPILLLTGRGGSHQKATALNAGADDYLVKPFDAEELIARVQALLRRRGLTSQPVLSWGELSVDLSRRHVAYAGRLVTVTPKEYAILELLLRNSQRAVSSGQILDHVWTSLSTPGEEVLRFHIKELRRKLVALGAPKDLIKTQHRVGYHLNPLYASAAPSNSTHQLTTPQVALNAVNEKLRLTLEQLRMTGVELQLRNQELQSARNELEQLVAERTAELVQAKAKLNQILDSAVCTIVSFRVFKDRDWQYEYWSEGCEQLFGYTPQELIADKNLWLSQVIPEDREAIIMPLFEAFCAGQSSRAEYRFRHRDGSTRWIFTTYASQAIATNCCLVTAAKYDISDHKRFEDTLLVNLRDIQLLHDLSTRLITESNIQVLYEEILTVAIALAQADAGTVQILDASTQDLVLLVTRGFDQSMTEHFHRVKASSNTPCGLALARGERTLINFDVPEHADPDGSLRLHVEAGYLSAQSMPLITRSGRPVGMVSTHWRQHYRPSERELQSLDLLARQAADLIEHRQSEIALRGSEHRYMSLVEASPVGIFRFDAAGHCTFVNQRWSEMTGRPAEAAVGIGWLQTLHPDDQEPTASSCEQWLQIGELNAPYQHEARIVRPDGSIVWVYCLALAERDANGGVTGYMGSLTDITERKRGEQIIQEQATLLDIASDAIAVRDLENRILYWNQGAERLYGWTATEAKGQNAIQLLYTQPSESSQAANDVMVKGEWQGELNQVTKTGQDVIVSSRWTLVRDQRGNPRFILVVNTDITEKKQLEAQLLRAQRLESIGTLASGVAHDLNNLLTPILLGVEILQKQFPSKRQQELLKIIGTNAHRGADLVQQVLTFARGQDGKRIPLQAKHLLNEILQTCQHTFPKSITLTLDVPTDLALVAADPTQLHQVVMNLCVNARDAMPQGGQLRLRAENFVADETYTRMHPEAQVGPYVVLAITDTGTGMTPEVLERIFDPFFTTKAVGQSTGLGLSVVQGIIHSHSGFVTVNSAVGAGTQFQVYLPAITQHSDLLTEALAVPQGQGELILVVDDEGTLREITKSVLEASNYQVLIANDGVEAIAVYAQNPTEIKVVIMDMMMPEMGGQTAIKTLAKLNPAVQVIVSSGLPTSQFAMPEITANIAASLQKPYTAQELLTTLHRVLSGDRT